MNTPTPRTDAATYPADCLGKTLVTNRDCARALERELTALAAERDQLRAENATLRAAQKACEACDEPTAFEVRKLRERAERAEAELAAANERLRSEAMDDYASIKDLQRELATEREKVRVLRLACERLRDCDWVISLPDRMDAVREIAREAIKKMESAK
jgi:cell division protein FtsB